MPDIVRSGLRAECNGIDLVHPIDRMPPGYFPYIFNARIMQEGRIDGRPGYSQKIQLQDTPNSIRRLNDPSKLYAPSGYIYVGGGGTKLYAGTEGAYAPIDTGYSGDPLSIIPFRPDQSPEPWMYVFDKNKSTKVRADSALGVVIRSIGVAPPSTAPNIEYGVPADVDIATGQSTAGWTATGAASGINLADRTNSGTPAIVSVLYYNVGTTGWCCINPNITQPFWMGERMKVVLNPGGSNQETVVVRNILPAIQSTTIAQIQYDSGSSGFCSIVLTNNPYGLARNSLIQLDAEVVRVLAVVQSPDGTTYSLLCYTTGTHSAGEVVTGLLSWYVYTVDTHSSGEGIASSYIAVGQSATGVGQLNLTSNINASAANSRPIDPANDWLHISIFLQNPQNVTNLQLLLSLDNAVNLSFVNPGNSYIFTITAAQLNAQGASGDSWVDVVVPISSATRSGSDYTRTLANISGIALQLTTTGACAWGFDWWYLFGTYGPVIQPNSPTGYSFASRFRDSTTGAHSVPGPLNRYQLFPLREAVIITPETTAPLGADTIDIYVEGGTITQSASPPPITAPLYLGSVENLPATPQSYVDALPDIAILAVNQPPDMGALQPWPILQAPWIGTVTVIGTTVVWLSGHKFDTNLLNNTAININGNVYLTYGSPLSDTVLQLTQDAGYLATANYEIGSPTLAAQSLPYAFGPLEGPFSPVILALGDPINVGLLYVSNPSDADSASDMNTYEVSVSELVSGEVWNGLIFVGSRDTVYCVRYSYLTTIGASNNTTFQWQRINSPSGMWSRWSCCRTPIGICFLGRDGIYIGTDAGAANISDAQLYPLFPHEGQPAKSVTIGTDIILPVNMTLVNNLRVSYCDERVRFCYVDTGGNWVTLEYEIYKKRWLLNHYANAINHNYLVEADVDGPMDQEILQMSLDTKSWMLAGGDTDNGSEIPTVVTTPSQDGGDERSQKLYVDSMIQYDNYGYLNVTATYNNAESQSPVLLITGVGSIQQSLQNIASLANLALYRNIGAKFSWNGGPDGPRLYAWEFSGFLQPYLSKFFVTQFNPFSFPGWKHMRRHYPAIISNGPVNFTVACQDGRTYGPFLIPSTGGQYRILPQMLPAGIKDLAFALQLDGGRQAFAFFPNDYVVEVKEWVEETFVKIAVFKA